MNSPTVPDASWRELLAGITCRSSPLQDLRVVAFWLFAGFVPVPVWEM